MRNLARKSKMGGVRDARGGDEGSVPMRPGLSK
jgi:hypothetical protein